MTSVWKYTISELLDVFADIVTTTTTPINNVILEDDYFPIECDGDINNNNSNNNNNDDRQQSQSQQQPSILLLYAVASIDYTEAFRIAYGLFRIVVLQRHEISSIRTLLLTGTCLQLNPANYTVWHTRRQCLSKLYLYTDDNNDNDDDVNIARDTGNQNHTNDNNTFISMIREELHIASILGGNNPKNYQIWYHRRAMLEHLPPYLFLQCITDTLTTTLTKNEYHTEKDDNTDWSTYPTITYLELDYIHTVLVIDAKNYHAWSHRQWIVTKMIDAVSGYVTTASSTTNTRTTTKTTTTVLHIIRQIYDTEIIYCNNLIHMDIRNNSVWNHRWYILHHQYCSRGDDKTKTTTTLPLHVIQEEIDYTIQIITIDPYNESPYKYLTALVNELCELCELCTEDDDDDDDDNHNHNQDSTTTTTTSEYQQFPAKLTTQLHLTINDMIQSVIKQLKHIEQHHLLPNQQENNRIDAMECEDITLPPPPATTTTTTTTTITSRIPSIHLCSTLFEIYRSSCRHLWMVDQITNDEWKYSNVIDELLSILQENDTIRLEYWKSLSENELK